MFSNILYNLGHLMIRLSFCPSIQHHQWSRLLICVCLLLLSIYLNIMLISLYSLGWHLRPMVLCLGFWQWLIDCSIVILCLNSFCKLPLMGSVNLYKHHKLKKLDSISLKTSKERKKKTHKPTRVNNDGKLFFIHSCQIALFIF